MSPGAGRTSGNHFDMVGARVPYAMVTPAFRARVSNEEIAGTIFSVQFGRRAQMGSTMSNMSNAVAAGLRTTGTGSGGGGICIVSEALLMGIARFQGESANTDRVRRPAASNATAVSDPSVLAWRRSFRRRVAFEEQAV